MSKVKYRFDTSTLTYKKVEVTWRQRIIRLMGYVATAIVFGALSVFVFTLFFDSPKERRLKREISQLELQYKVMNDRMNRIAQVLGELEDRDDNIYRVIFEADPIPATIRNAGFGGVNRYKELEGFDNSELVIYTKMKLDKLTKRLVVQSRSYDEVLKLARSKERMLASIPAIQPISNEKLTRIASGFSYRIHPIYKVGHFHSGIDFTAPIGTEIFCTGDGVVEEVENKGYGYGNYVMVNHGFGYKTLYAHMSRFKAKVGQKVKRGDIVGYVGNTGTSTGPHLHYEVIKNGNKVNPINFFFNDLDPEEYAKVIEIATQANQSLD